MTNDKYVKDMLHIHDSCNIEPKPSYMNLTTITFVFKVDSLLDAELIREKMKKNQYVTKKNSNYTFEWKLQENKFYNQVTITCTDLFSKKSVKLFPNGSVHVTGCTSIHDCKNVMKIIVALLTHILETEVDASDFEIYMINTNFSMNSNLNLLMVTEVAENRGCIVSFKPETYSAVKVKFVPGVGMKRITASIFSSGCILITGAKCLEEITESYRYLIDMLSGTRTTVNICEKKFDVYLGMTFDQWRKKLACN